MVERTASYHQVVLDIDADQVTKTVNATNRQIAKMTAEFGMAQAQADKFVKSAANYNRGFSKWGKTFQDNSWKIQQAGNQLGDFLIMLQGGFWVRPCVLHTSGAAWGNLYRPLGIGLAVGVPLMAAIAPALISAAKGADEAQEALEELVKETERLVEENQQLIGGYRTIAEMNAFREIRRITKEIADQEERLAEVQEARSSGWRRDERILLARIAVMTEELNTQQAIVDEFAKAFDLNNKLNESSNRTLTILEEISGLDISGVFTRADSAANTFLTKGANGIRNSARHGGPGSARATGRLWR